MAGTCPKCNRANGPQGGRTCMYCGTELVKAENPKHCPKCNRANGPQGRRTCMYCGTELVTHTEN